MKRCLSEFSGGTGYTLAEKLSLGFWIPVQHLVFKATYLPSSFRPLLLRAFGASVGTRVFIRRGVRIHLPWNLVIGDDCWIGEEVWFINHEKITIGSNVCISQRAIICSGGHDYQSSSLEFAHKSVEIKDGAWVCLDAKVLPGVTIGQCSVVSAGEIGRKSLPDYSMLVGGQVRTIDPPK
jgi:putative colanic acid biosynthesis acetyltransferase WcaF